MLFLVSSDYAACAIRISDLSGTGGALGEGPHMLTHTHTLNRAAIVVWTSALLLNKARHVSLNYRHLRVELNAFYSSGFFPLLTTQLERQSQSALHIFAFMAQSVQYSTNGHVWGGWFVLRLLMQEMLISGASNDKIHPEDEQARLPRVYRRNRSFLINIFPACPECKCMICDFCFLWRKSPSCTVTASALVYILYSKRGFFIVRHIIIDFSG